MEGGGKKCTVTIRRLKEQLSDLRETIKREEIGFNILSGQISSTRDRLYAIKEKEREDGMTIHEQEERIASLQVNIRNLEAEGERSGAAETLTILRLNRAKREEHIKKARELTERIVADAEEEKKGILAGPEEKREKILGR